MSHPPLLGWICWPRATAQAEQTEAERLASGESLYRPPHEHKNGVGGLAPLPPKKKRVSGPAPRPPGVALLVFSGGVFPPPNPLPLPPPPPPPRGGGRPPPREDAGGSRF